MLRRAMVVGGLVLLFAVGVRPTVLWPAEQAGDEVRTQSQEQPAPISVVVFDFGVPEGMSPEVGRQVADALSARLAQEKDFRVVPRTEIAAGLQKEGLEPPAPNDGAAAVEAAYLLGAELAVFGRAYLSGGSNYLAAKVVSTEQLTLTGVILKGAPEEEMTLLAERAAAKLSDVEVIQEQQGAGWSFVLPPQRIARVLRWRPVIWHPVAARKPPRVAVLMLEGHLGKQLPQSICELSAARFYHDTGLDAYACGTPESQQWAKGLRWEANERGRAAAGPMKDLPAETEGAGLVIVGHGWSSPTPKYGAYGKLAICDSRVEVKVIDRATGLQLATFDAWGLALGRTEEEAGRMALERAGMRVAANTLWLIEDWDKKHPSTTQAVEVKDGKPEQPGDETR
jgi:hypothetical protein